MLKNIIDVRNLSKSFNISSKEPGLKGTIKHSFKRNTETIGYVLITKGQFSDTDILIETDSPNTKVTNRWKSITYDANFDNSNLLMRYRLIIFGFLL